MQVAQPILEILERSALVGSTLTLPPGNLDRPVYEAVNKVIVAAGGKWNRSKKCHVFEGEAIDTIDPILLTGEYTRTKQDFGQFDTPADVVPGLLMLAKIEPGMTLLEPSAGLGNIVFEAESQGARVAAYEVDANRALACQKRCLLRGGMIVGDFLCAEPTPAFDIVAMNPPFAKKADIEHVMHAAKFVKPGGKLVAIMSPGHTFRTDARSVAFRAFLKERNAWEQALPMGSFKESGTNVNSMLVAFNV